MKKLLALLLLSATVCFAQAAPDIARTAPLGKNVTLTVSIDAGATVPLSYTWQKDGVALVNPANVTNPTPNSLLISGILYSQAGVYTVVVQNADGKTVSNKATLTVVAAPKPPVNAALDAVVSP